MNRKTSIFFMIIGMLVIGSITVAFYRFMIKKDYVIENQVDCDPSVDRCFVWKCDPASDVEEEKCSGEADKDVWYYQVVRRNAGRIPLCDPDKDESCDPWACTENEEDCATVFCDEKTTVKQEVDCSDPDEYNKDNPPMENDATCDDGETCNL